MVFRKDWHRLPTWNPESEHAETLVSMDTARLFSVTRQTWNHMCQPKYHITGTKSGPILNTPHGMRKMLFWTQQELNRRDDRTEGMEAYQAFMLVLGQNTAKHFAGQQAPGFPASPWEATSFHDVWGRARFEGSPKQWSKHTQVTASEGIQADLPEEKGDLAGLCLDKDFYGYIQYMNSGAMESDLKATSGMSPGGLAGSLDFSDITWNPKLEEAFVKLKAIMEQVPKCLSDVKSPNDKYWYINDEHYSFANSVGSAKMSQGKGKKKKNKHAGPYAIGKNAK